MRNFVIDVEQDKINVQGQRWAITQNGTLLVLDEREEKVAEFVNWRYVKIA